MKKLAYLFVLIFYLSSGQPAFAQMTYHVKTMTDGGDDTNNGLTWATAFATLNTALQAVRDNPDPGNEIWVAAGTYYPDEQDNVGNDDREKYFVLPPDVALYGGFPNTGNPSMAQRDYTLYPAILSGEIQQDNNATNNSIHVLFLKNVGENCTIDGFSIVKSRANGFIDPFGDGGGMYHEANGSISSPVIRNCIFENNYSLIEGGGFAHFSTNGGTSDLVLEHCTFRNNASGNRAAGAKIASGASSFTTALISACTFSDNIANFDGGALQLQGFLTNGRLEVIVKDSYFANNRGSHGGAITIDAVNNAQVNVVLLNNQFVENRATSWGGGILQQGRVGGHSSLDILQCTFIRNTAPSRGGAIGGFIGDGSTDTNVIQCSFSNNTAASHGSTIYIPTSSATNFSMANSIIWNEATHWGEGVSASHLSGTGEAITHSLIQDMDITGTSNLNSNPAYVISEANTLKLAPCSAAIDQGDNGSLPADEWDLNNNSNTTEALPVDMANNNRIFNATVDIGAYEFQGGSVAPTISTLPNLVKNTDEDDTGDCDVEVSWTHPAVIDDFPMGICPFSFTYELSGATQQAATTIETYDGTTSMSHLFNTGMTTVTYRAEDSQANEVSRSFTVTVADNENPTIVCPDEININSTDGECGAIVNFEPPVGTDNCSGATTNRLSDLGNGSFFPVGTTTVTYRVNDAASNSTDCSFTITIADNEMPELTNCPPAQFIHATDNCEVNLPDYRAFVTMMDNCSAHDDFVFSQTPAPASMPIEVGIHQVELKVTDPSDNEASCAFPLNICPPSPMEITFSEMNDLENGDFSSMEAHIENCTSVEFAITDSGVFGNVGERNAFVELVFDVGAGETLECVVAASESGVALANSTLPLQATLVNQQAVRLDWQNLSPYPTAHFEVQKSMDGLTFETIKRVYSSNTRHYTHLDSEPFQPLSYYRIVQHLSHGGLYYSDVQAVEIKNAGIVLFPNPTTDEVNIKLPFNKREIITIRVFDTLGRVVLEKQIQQSSSIAETQLHLQDLSNGVYWIQVDDGQQMVKGKVLKH